ncbi:MAG: hypothetical protein ABEJ65_04705 [bacterium]
MTWDKGRWIVIAIGIAYIACHLIPLWSIYVVPSDDYASVSATFALLEQPEQFHSDGIVSLVYRRLLNRAWLYGYLGGLLTTIFEPMFVPRILGFLFATGTFFLAGFYWSGPEDGLRAVVVTITFLHLSVNVNPIVGNKRSFVIVALLALLHPLFSRNRYFRLLIVALASGIYPPVALIILTVMGIKTLHMYWLDFGQEELFGEIREVMIAVVVFVVTISPFLVSLLSSSEGGITFQWVNPLYEPWSLFWGSYRNLIAGGRSALFRFPSSLSVFALFSVLSLTSYVVSRNDFMIKRSYVYLGLAGLLLWGSAHLLHPLLYHPVKYTRATLPLLAVLVFVDHNKSLAQNVRKTYKSSFVWELIFSLLFVVALVHYGYSLYNDSFVWINQYMYEWLFWPGVFAGMGCFIVGLGILGNKSEFGRAIAIVLFLLFSFYPHGITQFKVFRSQQFYPSAMKLHFKTIRGLPTNTVVAGPPALMDWVPGYGKRDVYFNRQLKRVSIACDRIKQFRTVYFSPDPRKVIAYMNSTPVTHILVDRKSFHGKPFTVCKNEFKWIGQGQSKPFLDRTFESYRTRSKKRFYLLNVDNIKRELE